MVCSASAGNRFDHDFCARKLGSRGLSPRRRARRRCLHITQFHECGQLCLHIVHRPSYAHRRRQHAPAERLRPRRGLRRRSQHAELAYQLGHRCGRRHQWIVARGRISGAHPHSLQPIHVTIPNTGAQPSTAKKHEVRIHPYTVFNLYAQSVSLNKLNYFGLGNDTSLADASVFGMTQTIVGANVVKPVFEWPSVSGLNLSFFGEANGRFVSIRGEGGQSVPSIQTVYDNGTAPGLSSQPGSAQFGEGIRIKPVLGDHLELNYSGKFQEFVSDSQNTFERWSVDLNHTFYLYGYTESGPPPEQTSNGTGPDECALSAGNCPPVSHSRNLNGSVGVRLFLSESLTAAGSSVPFYFQETLGGQDVNSQLTLPSYQDYRFRAPNLLLLQENVEHSIWGPFGVKFQGDQGRAALTRGDIGFSHLRHSYAAGLTLRAGALPMVSLMFAWGGPEGHHNIFNMNSSLLGGAARPLLD